MTDRDRIVVFTDAKKSSEAHDGIGYFSLILSIITR